MKTWIVFYELCSKEIFTEFGIISIEIHQVTPNPSTAHSTLNPFNLTTVNYTRDINVPADEMSNLSIQCLQNNPHFMFIK